MEKKDWGEILAGFGLWNLVEDISDDGDGKGGELQLTKDGKLLVSEIEQEIEKAREEGFEQGYKEAKFDCEMGKEFSKESFKEVVSSVSSKLKDNK